MGKNVWVAYVGNQLSKDKINKALELQLTGYYNGGTVKIKQLGGAVFGQIISSGIDEVKKDPVICVNDENQKYIYVTSYRDYFSESYDHLYYEYDRDCYFDYKFGGTKGNELNGGEEQIFGKISEVSGPHEIFNNAYQKFWERGLAKLLRHGSFNYINYNVDTNDIFACVGKKKTGNKGYNPIIYYAYFSDDRKDIVMSNDRTCILTLAEKIYKLPDNCYMINGEIKPLTPNNEIIEEEQKQESDNFTRTINEMVSKMALSQLQTLRASFTDGLERIADNYIATFDINSLLTKTQRDILINDVKNIVLASVRDDLAASKVVHTAVEEFQIILENTTKQRIIDYMTTIYIPQVYIVTQRDNSEAKIEGVFHEKFADILSTVEIGEPTMLVGPAGSGKNVAVGQVAKSLDLPMYYTNNANNEFKLLGYMDATGRYHETPFYTAFTKGGVFFLDEIDASDPTALIVVNSGLANGYMFFPNNPEPVKIHPDFRIVAAANTWGRGADLQYVGRNALDGSTMDRFDTVFFDYDEKMESVLYPDNEILEFMWSFRKAVFDTKTPHIVSTRGIRKVYTKKVNNIPVDRAITQNIIKGLPTDYLSILVGKLEEMKTIPEENSYYSRVKKISMKPTPKVEEVED